MILVIFSHFLAFHYDKLKHIVYYRQISKLSDGSESESEKVSRMKRAKSLPSPEAGDGLRKRTKSQWDDPTRQRSATRKRTSTVMNEKESKLIEKELMEVGSVSAPV